MMMMRNSRLSWAGSHDGPPNTIFRCPDLPMSRCPDDFTAVLHAIPSNADAHNQAHSRAVFIVDLHFSDAAFRAPERPGNSGLADGGRRLCARDSEPRRIAFRRAGEF